MVSKTSECSHYCIEHDESVGREIDEALTKYESENLRNARDRMEVFWPFDNYCYKAAVSSVASSGLHKISDDDGKEESIHLKNEGWRSAPINANFVPTPSFLKSQSLRIIEQVVKTFGTSHLWSSHLMLWSNPLINLHSEEEESFLRTERRINTSDLSSNASIISSPMIYKTKSGHDDYLI